MPSAYEIATLVLGALTALGGMILSLVLWIGREEKKKADDTRADVLKLRTEDLKDLEVRMSVLETSSVPEKVDRHEERITAHDQLLGQLVGDVRHIRDRVDEDWQRRKGGP